MSALGLRASHLRTRTYTGVALLLPCSSLQPFSTPCMAPHAWHALIVYLAEIGCQDDANITAFLWILNSNNILTRDQFVARYSLHTSFTQLSKCLQR
jgi:hypothetical protein